MSGGVGPSCDISLPKQEQNPSITTTSSSKHAKTATTTTTTKGFSLTLRQLNCLVIMIVLAASGMVSFEAFTLVIFSLIYMYFLSYFAFPTNLNSPTQQQPIFDQNSKILGIYVLFAAIIGLFLPVLYILHGILEGDKEGIKIAAPHVFLLASQVFMEGLSVSDRFSLPIRVFVPVFYNSCRLYTLQEWLKEELFKVGEGRYGGSSYYRLWVGRGLAIANFLFWSYNLFGFLLPVYLPRAFKRYFSSNGSTTSKQD